MVSCWTKNKSVYIATPTNHSTKNTFQVNYNIFPLKKKTLRLFISHSPSQKTDLPLSFERQLPLDNLSGRLAFTAPREGPPRRLLGSSFQTTTRSTEKVRAFRFFGSSSDALGGSALDSPRSKNVEKITDIYIYIYKIYNPHRRPIIGRQKVLKCSFKKHLSKTSFVASRRHHFKESLFNMPRKHQSTQMG